MTREIQTILEPSTIEAIEMATTGSCRILDAGPRTVALTPGRELTAEQLDELKRMLLDPQSWFFAAKRCLPRATADFRLTSEQGNVSILIELNCSGWIVTAPRQKVGGFFDPIQLKVRILLKAIYAEYASPTPRSLWRSGTIAMLRAEKSDGGYQGT